VQVSGAERIEAEEPHMGTMFRIVLYAGNVADGRAAIRKAFDRVAELDAELSDYKPDSELNRLCRDGVGRDVAVSEDLYTVLKASQALADSTGGAFDITIGPVVRVWRKARQAKQLPSPAEIAEALRLTGYQKLHIGDHTARLDLAGMQLDLGAIAKGYAADEALRLLRNQGFPEALVAASGDIAIGDAPPGKAGWKIGAETFESSNRTLELHNAAVSTSGDTEQYVEIGGVRYSHIINPATGNGLTQRIGVTVIAEKAIDSDALATAASVVTEQHGAAAALALIEVRGAKGIIVSASGGKMVESVSAKDRE
jgi:FAD:protein FMN transferase